MERVHLYDTTLRDGAQGEGISFSVDDKLAIAMRLDEFGIDTIEGGFPGSNPKDRAFFERIREAPLRHARIAAFGMTRRKSRQACDDESLISVVQSRAPVATIVGKSWDLHIKYVLRATLEDNLAMIEDSLRFLKDQGQEVVYDAEHFFDGYRDNPEYAIETLRAAEAGGASVLVLCDTNGGSMPSDILEIVSAVGEQIATPLGIHTHNDSEVGVANTLMGVQAGARHVQGTINGYGERCGNANLCSIIANLQLKMGFDCVSEGQMTKLTGLSHFVDEIANMIPRNSQAFVGRSAFAHKGGLHVDAMVKHPKTYEHVQPATVGNETRVLTSELSGAGAIAQKLQARHPELNKNSPLTREIYDTVLRKENEGYILEGAEASFELIVRKATGNYQKLFDLVGYRVIVERRPGDPDTDGVITEATLKLKVDGQMAHTVAEGDGPVHALDNALRLALTRFYPELIQIKLTDFKVRVVNDKDGTAAKVRVLIDSMDERESWSTVGVSTNLIEASWEALCDSVEHGLLKRIDASRERAARPA